MLFQGLECVITCVVVKKKPKQSHRHTFRSHKEDLFMHMRKVIFYYHFHIPNPFIWQISSKGWLLLRVDDDMIAVSGVSATIGCFQQGEPDLFRVRVADLKGVHLQLAITGELV